MSEITPRTAIALVATGVLSLLAAIGFALWGGSSSEADESSPRSHSRSAIGHAAFLELLRQRGHEVIVSRARSADRTGAEGLLVFAEPRPDDEPALQAIQAARDSGAAMLIICPKYRGTPDRENPAWIEQASLHATDAIERVLSACGFEARIVRPKQAERSWEGESRDLGDPSLNAPQLLAPLGDSLTPIVYDERGVLLAAAEDEFPYWGEGALPRLWILSDPDVISNHGIGEPGNAAFATALAEWLLPGAGPIVFDEVVHGAGIPESIWLAFGRWPLVLVLIDVLLIAGFAMWASAPRFGPTQSGVLPPRRGVAVLVESSAELQLRGRGAEAALQLAWEQARRAVLEHLRAPALERGQAQVLWLGAFEARRAMADGAAQIDAAVREVRRGTSARKKEILELARRIHRWREELIHGDGRSRGALAGSA